MAYIKGRVHGLNKPIERVLWCQIKLEEPLKPEPGQFVMLWIPGQGEIPLSISDYSVDEGILELVIAKVGKVTTYIHERLKEGDLVALRGPYGRGFSVVRESTCLIVAGGCGLAPFPFLVRKLLEARSSVDVILGFKTASEVFHVAKFVHLARRTFVATDDGSYGLKGTVVDVIKGVVDIKGYDIVYVCGKEKMMKAVVDLCREHNVRCEASLERYMKCGIGICGACVLDPLGLRVCRDGPVFSSTILALIEDFGQSWRDHCGRKIPIPES